MKRLHLISLMIVFLTVVLVDSTTVAQSCEDRRAFGVREQVRLIRSSAVRVVESKATTRNFQTMRVSEPYRQRGTK